MEYFPFLDKDEAWQLYSALNIFGRLNRNDYDLYDYQQYRFMFAVYHDGALALNRFSYQYQIRNYSQFDALSNTTHYFNWKFNKSFKTRTSLITNVGLASRNYESQNSFIVVRDTIYNDNRRGRGHRQHPPQITTRRISVNTNPIVLNQLSLSIRIAQNIFSNLGVYVQYLKSFDFSSQGTFQNYGSYLGDDELFDDPLSYLSNEWSSQLTWIFSSDWQLKFNTSYNRKSYINEKAFLSATDSIASGGLRKDKKLDFFLTLDKSIAIKSNFTLNVAAQIYYINNQSNSYWYHYKNLITGISLKIHY